MSMRRLLAVLIGLACAFLALGSASAVPDPNAGPAGQISDVKTQTGLVQFLFSAGNLPDGSTVDPKSVTVTVDGTTLDATASPADAATAPRAAPVREVILTLDVSGSMQGDGITAARGAALSYAGSLPKDVRVGLLTFSDTPHLLLAPTTSRIALNQAIGKVKAGGGTALYDGVFASAAAMKNLPANADRRLLVLSDGDDTSSSHSLADATGALGADGIAADVVAFRLPGDQKVLARIASASRGRVLPATNAGDLAGVFATAAKAFQQQVLVTVTVPEALANKTATLDAAVNAGSLSVTASKTLRLPPVGAAATNPKLTISAPASAPSNTRLWLIMAMVFVVMLAIALVALFLPVLSHARAEKASRLAEMHRYRVVGAIGADDWATPPLTVQATQTAFTQRTLSFVDKTVRARGQRERIVSELDRAGLRMRPEEWAVVQVLTVVGLGVVVGVLAGSFIGLIVGAVLGWAGVRVFVKTKIDRRQAAFLDQLPATLQLIAGSLRSGFSLNQSLDGVVREGTEPTASEFARALTEVRLGSELVDALDDVSDRMRCDDLHWVVLAVRISREVGGNLAEVLGNTVSTMRERAELRGLVRVLSAEGRISAKVLIALPFLLAAFLLTFRKGYLSPLIHSGVGIGMILAGLALIGLGSLWLNKLVKIEV